VKVELEDCQRKCSKWRVYSAGKAARQQWQLFA
jgi:hypothetical protein